MFRTVLIGPAPAKWDQAQGGIAEFIKPELYYAPFAH
jgi:hypothetical protein